MTRHKQSIKRLTEIELEFRMYIPEWIDAIQRCYETNERIQGIYDHDIRYYCWGIIGDLRKKVGLPRQALYFKELPKILQRPCDECRSLHDVLSKSYHYASRYKPGGFRDQYLDFLDKVKTHFIVDHNISFTPVSNVLN